MAYMADKRGLRGTVRVLFNDYDEVLVLTDEAFEFLWTWIPPYQEKDTAELDEQVETFKWFFQETNEADFAPQPKSPLWYDQED